MMALNNYDQTSVLACVLFLFWTANDGTESLGSDQWLSADTFAWTLQIIATTGRRETASGV